MVADEVRNLASKSGEAAKNTTILIEESLQAVENGNRITAETAKAMQEVVEGSRRIKYDYRRNSCRFGQTGSRC